jgi:hypothetical protein
MLDDEQVSDYQQYSQQSAHSNQAAGHLFF